MSEPVSSSQIGGQDLVRSLYHLRGIAESELELLKSKAGQNERALLEHAKEGFSKTLYQVNQIIELIAYFRSFQGPQSGSGAADQSKTRLQESVRELLRAISYEHSLKNITLLKIIPHDLEPVAIMREHLDAILYQLIVSARRAIGNHPGMITIEAQKKIYLTPENRDTERLEIRIADTGKPISEEALPALFDPYDERDKLKHSRRLGLYLVKKLVYLNQGTIRVETASQGTSFFLEFPGQN